MTISFVTDVRYHCRESVDFKLQIRSGLARSASDFHAGTASLTVSFKICFEFLFSGGELLIVWLGLDLIETEFVLTCQPFPLGPFEEQGVFCPGNLPPVSNVFGQSTL